MFYRILNTSLLWNRHHLYIKPNFICANKNPKLQNFFKKSTGASKRKLLSIVVNSSILDLAEFSDLSPLNYIATILHYLSQQIGLKEKHDSVEEYRKR